ncbi:MAG: hypothetical protein ABI553_00950 [Chloroflexota bacterium]
MTDDLEGRVRASLRRDLPPAPTRLQAELDRLPINHPRVVGRRAVSSGLLTAAAVVIVLVGVVGVSVVPRWFGATVGPSAAPSDLPSATASLAASPSPAFVEGLPVHTVSQLLALRDSGTLGDQPVALRGYWSDLMLLHTCTPYVSKPGELEISCYDGEFGITERNEQIMVFTADHGIIVAHGPRLTPFMTEDQKRQVIQAPVNGQQYPPVPIVVIGHFNDPRAADCQPSARQLCRDRLVVDRIVEFDLASVPPPEPTPAPTPFPYDSPPPPKFHASRCAGDVPYTFIGWKPLAELVPDRYPPEAVAFAMVTRDVMEIGDRINGPGQPFKIMGRLICYAYGEGTAVGFTWVPGSAYRLWDDGHTTPLTP